MKKNRPILILICLMLSISTKAQTDFSNTHSRDSSKNLKQEVIFTTVEQMPEFPGGQEKLNKFLLQIKYPRAARKKGVSGKVYVTFVVNSDGKINNVKILRGLGYGLDEEVLRVVNKMPDWIPGKQNGKEVNVQFNLPVNFNLN